MRSATDLAATSWPTPAPLPMAADLASVSTHTDCVLDSAALLQGQKSVVIAHNGVCYRLQTTKLGKLILTK